MAFIIRNPIAGTTDIYSVDDAQRLPLGTEVQAWDGAFGGATFVYCKGVASLTTANAVLINQDDWTTVRAVAGLIGKIGFSMSAPTASQFGWFQLTGKTICKTSGAFADNANCYLTASASAVGSSIVAGDRIKNMKGASAGGTTTTSNGVGITNSAEMEIDRPFTDAGLAA